MIFNSNTWAGTGHVIFNVQKIWQNIFNKILFCQFLILVIDSTDRERLAITKAELYQMLANEVSTRQIKGNIR